MNGTYLVPNTSAAYTTANRVIAEPRVGCGDGSSDTARVTALAGNVELRGN